MLLASQASLHDDYVFAGTSPVRSLWRSLSGNFKFGYRTQKEEKIMRGGLYLWPFPFRASFLRTVKTPWSLSDPVLFTRAVPYWCFKKTKHFFSVCVHVCAHAWSSADTLESVLLFHQVGFGNQMHILRLGGQWPSLMSHLISSSHALFKDGWSFSL